MKRKNNGLEDCWEGVQWVWHRRSWMRWQETQLGRKVGTEILMKHITQLLGHSEIQKRQLNLIVCQRSKLSLLNGSSFYVDCELRRSVVVSMEFSSVSVTPSTTTGT